MQNLRYLNIFESFNLMKKNAVLYYKDMNFVRE